jgi:hypothetical protein
LHNIYKKTSNPKGQNICNIILTERTAAKIKKHQKLIPADNVVIEEIKR